MSLKDEKNNSFFIFKKLKQKIENDKKMRRNDRLDSIFSSIYIIQMEDWKINISSNRCFVMIQTLSTTASIHV